MANEFTTTIAFTATKGGASISTSTLSKTSDMTGTDMATSTQAVGTAAEILNTPGDIGYPAHVTIKNNDGTNFVTVYQDSGGMNQVSKLLPGESCHLRAIAAAPYVKADTASCQIQWWASEV